MTQTERVIAALQRAGDKGITSVDFLLPDVIDGGKPITRIAARVLDARGQGFHIFTDGTRNGCAVYKLTGQPSGHTIPADTGMATEPVSLSSSGSVASQLTVNAIFGWEDAA